MRSQRDMEGEWMMNRNEATLQRIALHHFGLDQVVLTGDYQANAFEKELEYLNSYNVDRLLAGFRETRGLMPKAVKYPGWEDTEIRGHTLGHYLSAFAQAYSAYERSGDAGEADRIWQTNCHNANLKAVISPHFQKRSLIISRTSSRHGFPGIRCIRSLRD